MKDVKHGTDMFVGDLHGNIYALEKAIEIFERDGYDRLIFLGDYVDSRHVTDVEIVHTLKEVIKYKRKNLNNVFLLLGNHDMQYVELSEQWYRCSGFRLNISWDLHNIFTENRDLFQVAYYKQGYLATHAGVTDSWLTRYHDRIVYYTVRSEDFSERLNRMSESHDKWILSTVPEIRDGDGIGGPLWADITELDETRQCKRFKQIVGHNKVPDILTVGDVIFTDCLAIKTKFLIIDHDQQTEKTAGESQGETEVSEGKTPGGETI